MLFKFINFILLLGFLRYLFRSVFHVTVVQLPSVTIMFLCYTPITLLTFLLSFIQPSSDSEFFSSFIYRLSYNNLVKQEAFTVFYSCNSIGVTGFILTLSFFTKFSFLSSSFIFKSISKTSFSFLSATSSFFNTVGFFFFVS